MVCIQICIIQSSLLLTQEEIQKHGKQWIQQLIMRVGIGNTFWKGDKTALIVLTLYLKFQVFVIFLCVVSNIWNSYHNKLKLKDLKNYGFFFLIYFFN